MENEQEVDYTYPEASLLDKSIEVLYKSLSSIMPNYLGGIVDLLQMSHKRRVEDWMRRIGKRVSTEQLIQVLSNNEVFKDMLYTASAEAMKTSEEEKLDALCDAAFNFAFEELNFDASEARIYLRILINDLDAWHIRLLNFLNDPLPLCIQKGLPTSDKFQVKLAQLIQICFPELQGKDDFISMIWNDLADLQLVKEVAWMSIYTGSEIYSSCTTIKGAKLMKLIASRKAKT